MKFHELANWMKGKCSTTGGQAPELHLTIPIPRDRRPCGLGVNGREHLYNARPKIAINLAMHSQILFYNCIIQSSTHSNSQNSKARPMLSLSAQQQESPSISPSTPQKPFNKLSLKKEIRKTKAAQSSSSGISPQ